MTCHIVSQCPTKTWCVPMRKQSSRTLLSLVSKKKISLSAYFYNFALMNAFKIGNGPSAITLSYLLSGHVPYYRGNSSDDFLHLRLSENIDQPLVLQDLEFLSDVSYFKCSFFEYSRFESIYQGLEGRSTNPVSVLFDALAHPDADLGVEQPSLLEWRFRDDLQVDHVVLGKGQPGGAWKVSDLVHFDF